MVMRDGIMLMAIAKPIHVITKHMTMKVFLMMIKHLVIFMECQVI